MSAGRRSGARMWRLRVDPVACDAYGYCADLLPEVVTRDEWGYPIISKDPLPAHLLELARRAVADCPRRALVLVEDPARAGPAPVLLATSRGPASTLPAPGQ